MKAYRTLLILSLSTLALPALAQVNFRASVSKNKVAKGENFTVEFKLNAEGSNFKAPNFNGFRVMAGPSLSTTSFVDNRGMRYEASFSYVLRANSEGARIIGPAYIKVDGEVYKTEPIKITVTKERPPDPNSPEAKARKAVKLKIQVSKTEVYRGEPLYARYRLYFRNDIGRYQIGETPDYAGFYRKRIERDRIETESEMLEGKRYTAGNIEEMVLIPQRGGEIRPGNLTMDIPVGVRTGRYTVFGRPDVRTIQLELATAFPTIKVKELPSVNKPTDFSGAVGQFEFVAELDKDELSTDESLTLKFQLKGEGNIRLVDLPKAKLPKAFEVFDPERKERIRTGSFGMRGEKSAEYLMVPRYAGEYKIGPFRFTYFDPDKEEYITIESPQYLVKVSGDQQAPEGYDGNAPAATTKEKVDFIGEEMLFIKTEAERWRKHETAFLGSRVYQLILSILGLATAAILIAFIWLRRRAKNWQGIRQQKASREALKTLARAKKELKAGEAIAFYQALLKALQDYFQVKLNLPASAMSKENLDRSLAERDVDEDLRKQVIELTNRAEMARYAGAKLSDSNEDYRLATKLLTRLDAQL